MGKLGGKGDPLRPGLGFVDFYFRPHLDSPEFPTSQRPALAAVSAHLDRPLHAADDLAALVVTDGEVAPVGSGEVLHI